MQSRFKFRVWDTEKNEWLWTSEPDVIPYNGFHLFGECMLFQNVNISKLSNCVIQQFTWLKDKNGKEIYEGDIVEYSIEWGYWQQDYTINRIVEYKEWHYNPFVHWHEEFTQNTYPECCEVIGNIYENPELLKYDS